MLVLPEPHDGAFAEIPLDLTERRFKGFLLVHIIEIPFDHPEWLVNHESLSLFYSIAPAHLQCHERT
jgi:hypothetical protein